jgi:hypothetical protein
LCHNDECGLGHFGTTLVLEEGGKRPEPDPASRTLEEEMTTMAMNLDGTRGEAVVARDTGLTGRVIVTWSVAGGLLVGGFLVAGMTLAGRLSANALLTTAGVLYVMGALLGFAHGAALGFLGRPAELTAKQAVGKIGMAAMYAVPALILGFLAAGWIAMTAMALYLDRLLPLVGVGLGWLVGLAMLVLAAMSGAEALKNAYARWEDRRLGTVLVAATFTALLVLLLADRPELWGTRLRVTEIGAILLAAVGAFWVAGPVVTLALHLVRRLPAARTLGFGSAPRMYLSVALGLGAGLALGLLALPFHKAAFTTAAAVGPMGSVVHVLSRALVDEVLLRLFLVTGIVWMMVRYNATSRGKAALIAVLLAAVVQAVLYLPGVNGIGFPTLTGASVFMAMTVVLPALVFGAIFWKRGFATALLAHATALLVVAFMI